MADGARWMQQYPDSVFYILYQNQPLILGNTHKLLTYDVLHNQAIIIEDFSCKIKYSECHG